ncbi:MAG: lipid IV(A) 3-deoxy-D-manno-octulosonic acid transferase [Sulfuritalea sp.]|jgi:3-deoxy-D-manno-octulosonic-acid transferase|nr:lipid IV(A) 3-deoxy-D-manno-octulosonic acid transferase [Sulfuritalea sp.]
MARFLYTLAAIALLPWAALHLLWRARRQPEYLRHWGERFGFFSAADSCEPTRPTIWLHAVSVGETRAAQPLLAALRERFPGHRILLTHMTPTGRATSEALFGDTVERIYLPYDTPWAMRGFLRRYRPRFGLIMETELWPNLIAACREAGVPLWLVNARLSERSARRYATFSALTREALQGLTAIGAQTDADAARLETLGALRVTVTGNVKFDIVAPAQQLELGRELRTRCGDRPVWLAASTREGEEALILSAWNTALGNGSRKVGAGDTALLVIVPRHPQRFDEVARLVAGHGFALQRRSETAAIEATTGVLLGDSMGEMFAYYAAADLAFIGGSLLDFGSQNLIEAAACGTPILIGPSTRNFAEAAREALACGAAQAIRDADDLVHSVNALLAAAQARQRMSAAGRAFAARHRGATARTLELITPAAR